MPAFRALVQGAFCVGAAWAYHVDHEATVIVSETGEVSMADPGVFAQVPNATVTESHNTSTSAAHADGGSVAAPLAAKPKPTAALEKPASQGGRTEATQRQGAPAPSKSPAKGKSESKADAGKPGTLKPAQMMKEAERSLERAEQGLEKAKAVLSKANEALSVAKKEEEAATKHRETVLAELRQAKDKRSADYKRSKAGEDGKDDVKADDNAIRKAERAYEIATGKCQRAKATVLEKSQAVAPATEAVKAMEAAKAQAHQDVQDAHAKQHEQEQWDHRQELEAGKMQAKNDKIQKRKEALVSEYKNARQERLSKKGADPKDIKHMKAHEEVLVQSVHKAEEQAKELHEAMKSYKKTHGS